MFQPVTNRQSDNRIVAVPQAEVSNSSTSSSSLTTSQLAPQIRNIDNNYSAQWQAGPGNSGVGLNAVRSTNSNSQTVLTQCTAVTSSKDDQVVPDTESPLTPEFDPDTSFY